MKKSSIYQANKYLKKEIFFYFGVGIFDFFANNIVGGIKMITATATQVKNSFGKYLSLALNEGEVQIVRYNKVIAKLIAVKNDENVNTKQANLEESKQV